jgi:predicted Zn-dependent protease
LDFGEAWQGFRRVDPGSPHGDLETGSRLLSAVREDARAGRWAQGRAKAVELVRLFPDYSLVRLMAADLAAQSGEDEAAMEGYADFLAREPGHRAATENFARVLRRRGQGEKADRLLASLSAADLPAGNRPVGP